MTLTLLPASLNEIEINEKATIIKSIIFQGFRIQESLPFIRKPSTITFKTSSKVKSTVTTKSMQNILSARSLSGSFNGDSRMSMKVENKIRNRITLSKCSNPTSQTENFLTGFYGVISQSDLPTTVNGFLLGFSAASTSIYLIALMENLCVFELLFSLISWVRCFRNFLYSLGDLKLGF